MSNKALQAKKDTVEEIKQKIEEAESIMLVDYRGLNVDELTELRSQYREANVDYKVYKNTMLRFAFKDAGLEEFNEFLKGPSAVAFGYGDPVGAAKVTAEFAKENEKLEMKAGIVGGQVIGIDKIKALASLPSKETLLGQVVGGINAPIQGFANVLGGSLRSLVNVLNAIVEEQEA